MNNPDKRFWPFRPRASIISSIIMLVGLLWIIWALRKTSNWPGKESDTIVIIGLMVFSLLPVLLAVLDIIIERGGVIKYGGLEIDFSKINQMGIYGLKLNRNIGHPGEPLSSSYTSEIIDSLRQATVNDVVIIDLEEGQEWWETRLLLLLAGAVRLGRPEKIVFVGKENGIDGCFQGWGYSNMLLNRLLEAHPQYLLNFHTAQIAARQWELVEPVFPYDPAEQIKKPCVSKEDGLAFKHLEMAFNNETGLPNPLLAEQLLATVLGENIESQEAPRTINLDQLDEFFSRILQRVSVDESWAIDKQLYTFFEKDTEYIAVTRNSKYSRLVPRLAVLNSIVGSLMMKKQ